MGDISDALVQSDSNRQRKLCKGCSHLMPSYCWLSGWVVVGIAQWRGHRFKSVSSKCPRA
ncbi:hypothetical protein D3C78_1893130 [compost metagenome]